jgi:hypothetical protein
LLDIDKAFWLWAFRITVQAPRNAVLNAFAFLGKEELGVE